MTRSVAETIRFLAWLGCFLFKLQPPPLRQNGFFMRQFGFQYATIWRKAKLSLCFCYINECFSVLLRLDFLSIAYVSIILFSQVEVWFLQWFQQGIGLWANRTKQKCAAAACLWNRTWEKAADARRRDHLWGIDGIGHHRKHVCLNHKSRNAKH